jgi:hypothetical protein
LFSRYPEPLPVRLEPSIEILDVHAERIDRVREAPVATRRVLGTPRVHGGIELVGELEFGTVI